MKTVKYDRTIKVAFTNSQIAFMDEVAALHGISRREAIRIAVDQMFVRAMQEQVARETASDG